MSTTESPSHPSIRRFKCLPPPVDKPRVPPHRLYPIKNPQVTNNVNQVNRYQILNLDWGNLGFSSRRDSSVRRVIQRPDAPWIPNQSLSSVRGRITGRNVEELVDAVDNVVVEVNPKFEKDYAQPQLLITEWDLSEFYVPQTCRLKHIHHCDVYVGDRKILTDVELQFVYTPLKDVVYGHCRVYIDDGPKVKKQSVTLKWTNPTTDTEERWEISNLTFVYGPPALRRKSRVGVCPYCPEVKAYNKQGGQYNTHLIQKHGICGFNKLVPDPVKIKRLLGCPICLATFFPNSQQSFVDPYLRHFSCSQAKHVEIKKKKWHRRQNLRGQKRDKLIDSVEVEDEEEDTFTKISRTVYYI